MRNPISGFSCIFTLLENPKCGHPSPLGFLRAPHQSIPEYALHGCELSGIPFSMRDVERQGWNPGQMCGLDDEQSSLPACPRVRAWTWAQASGCRVNSSKEVLHAPRIPEAPEYSYMTGTWVCPQKAGSACVVSNQALFTKIKKKKAS